MGGRTFSQRPILSTAALLKQSQIQASSQMQKSILLLKASKNALSDLIQEEVNQNPLLEIDILDGEPAQKTALHDPHSRSEPIAKESPYHCVQQQIRDLFSGKSEQEQKAAALLQQHLDSRGFIDSSLEQLAQDEQLPLELLKEVQMQFIHLLPTGVGAQNLQQALLWQLESRIEENSSNRHDLIISIDVVSHFWNALLKNEVEMIERKIKAKPGVVRRVIREIVLNLDFSPLKTLLKEINPLAPSTIVAIKPDITIEKEKGVFIAKVDQENVALNLELIEALKKARTKDAASYLQKNRKSGEWLISALAKRKETIGKIAQCLIKEQKSYFEGGVLRPLSLTKVAKEIGRATSTLSRAVEGKWVSSPRGLQPLKSLFPADTKSPFAKDKTTQSLSKTELQNIISEIIASENKANPLSDQAISELLKEKEIDCSRRTVAKYRTALQIPRKSLRKQDYSRE